MKIAKLCSLRNSKREEGKCLRDTSVQYWIPVEDIKNNLIYTRDDRVVLGIKVFPTNIDLLSFNEKTRIVSALHRIINGVKIDMQWLSFSRAVDLDAYNSKLENMAFSTKDYTKKKLLKGYIKQAAEMTIGGQALERLFYILIGVDISNYGERQVTNIGKELADNLITAGLMAEVSTDQDLIEMLFIFHNPTQGTFEDIPQDSGPYLPTQYGGYFNER